MLQRETGRRLRPYSPYINPIEQVFAKGVSAHPIPSCHKPSWHANDVAVSIEHGTSKWTAIWTARRTGLLVGSRSSKGGRVGVFAAPRSVRGLRRRAWYLARRWRMSLVATA